MSRCVELNFRAAALQSGASCALLRSVVGGRDVFASGFYGHNEDLFADIDATCDYHAEDARRPACPEEVADVVAAMEEGGCEVTGGSTVADFLRAVDDSREGFASLARLACGPYCFAEVRRGVERCRDDPDEDDCMEYLSCECLSDLFSAVEALSEDGKEDYLKLNAAMIEGAVATGTWCTCKELNRRAGSLESSPSCALPVKVERDGDVFAGDAATIANTCNAAADTPCVEDVVDVIDGLIKYGCEIKDADAGFMYSMKYSGGDFEATTEFACSNHCYNSLWTCQYYYQNAGACLDLLSCDCKRDFLTFIGGLTEDFKGDYLGVGASTIGEMRGTVDTCECDNLNAKAASLQTEGYCALHESIVREGSMFAVNLTDARSSTCPERTSCVGNVTEVLGRIRDREGCELRQGTDAAAKFLYRLDNNSEWEGVTNFVCGGGGAASPAPDDGRCYDDIKAVVDDCEKGDDANGCAGSARSDCMESFLGTVGRLSDDARDNFVGIDASTLGRMESWNAVEENATSPTTRPTPRNSILNENDENGAWSIRGQWCFPYLILLVWSTSIIMHGAT